MTTRNSLSYRELAKAEAVVKRVVSSDELVRLSQAAVAVGATHAEFSFEFTGNGRDAYALCKATQAPETKVVLLKRPIQKKTLKVLCEN